MTYRNNQDDSAMLLIGIAVIILVLIAWKIHQVTGLSFDTLQSVGRNLLVFFGVLAAAVFSRMIPVARYWNWILAAFWLTLIPALNEWGGVTTEEQLSYFSDPIELKWYAQSIWQIIVAVAITTSKYVYNWAYENITD